MNRAELDWAAKAIVSALNTQLASAGASLGWNYVGGIASAFLGHGLCASEPAVVNSFPDAFGAQKDYAGMVHPNTRAHRIIADSLVAAVEGVLGPPSPERGDGDTTDAQLTETAGAGTNTMTVADGGPANIARAAGVPAATVPFVIGDWLVVGANNERTAEHVVALAPPQLVEVVGVTPEGVIEVMPPFDADHVAGELVVLVDDRELVEDPWDGERPPPGRMLSGHELLLRQKPGKPETRRAQLVSKDGPELGLASEDEVAALVAAGGTLRIRALGGDGFDATYPLPADGWAPLKAKKPTKGLRYRGSGAVQKLVFKAGKQLVVKARGAGLAFSLDTDPDVVEVELTVGDRRHCFAFGGKRKFKAGKHLLRRKAGRPTACPPPSIAVQ